MAVRIQLASNFQVVELTYDSWEEMDIREVNEATELVNGLGQSVKNEIKTKPSKEEKKEEPVEKASEKQINFAVKLGLDKAKAESMNKQEVWKWIQEHK